MRQREKQKARMGRDEGRRELGGSKQLHFAALFRSSCRGWQGYQVENACRKSILALQAVGLGIRMGCSGVGLTMKFSYKRSPQILEFPRIVYGLKDQNWDALNGGLKIQKESPLPCRHRKQFQRYRAGE